MSKGSGILFKIGIEIRVKLKSTIVRAIPQRPPLWGNLLCECRGPENWKVWRGYKRNAQLRRRRCRVIGSSFPAAAQAWPERGGIRAAAVRSRIHGDSFDVVRLCQHIMRMALSLPETPPESLLSSKLGCFGVRVLKDKAFFAVRMTSFWPGDTHGTASAATVT
jgi:hypothetical protein